MSKRSASQIIAAFTTAQQRAELDADSTRFLASVKARKERKLEILKDNTKQQGPSELTGQEQEYRKMIEHKCPIENLYNGHFAGVQINPQQGLSDPDVRKLREQFGLNRLTPKEKTHWIIMLFAQMTGQFSLMLWAGSILCFIAYGLDPNDPSTLYLGIVLAVVVFLTGLVTFFQNSKSESIMETIAKNRPQKAAVKRNGTRVQIPPQQIVPGDIVLVSKGDKVPADIRMIKVSDMQVDNSALTGESDLMTRTIECTNQENALETKNVAFYTTNCGNGSCEGIVIMTGDRTIIGQIANLASGARSEESPLRVELNFFIHNITIIAVFLGIFFFVAGFIIGYPAITNLVFAIGIIVANVPQGMLATITAALSLSARRLAQNQVIVQNLESVETLGSTSCICSDQTGTLTQNKMTVEHVWNNNRIFQAQNKQKYPKDVDYDDQDPNFRALIDCAVVCSEASFNLNLPEDKKKEIQNNNQLSDTEKDAKLALQDKNHQEMLNKEFILDWPTFGDATESGLIKFFHAIEDISQVRARYPVGKDIGDKESQLPFNSTNQFAYNIVQSEFKEKDPQTNENVTSSYFCLYSKGAPERIWKKCTHILIDNQPVPIDESWNQAFNKANQFFGGNGERVLGFAKYNFPKDKFKADFQFDMNQFNFVDSEQVFLGLVSLIDPPRDAVPYAVLKCKAAGIKVIMVTGDQELTAASIAKQINIINKETVNEIAERTGRTFQQCLPESDAIVISGDRLARIVAQEQGLPEAEKGKKLQELLMKPQIVFARTSPAQKLIIVQANQSVGHMVAVTGDGVNDSPAIKKADIGVAMGIAGTEVTKDAADMILMNDDFASIVMGIQEGRKIFDNLKKTIAYILTSNIPEIVPFILFIIVSLPLAISTVLILCVDLGTDMVPAISIAYEEAQLDIMVRKPRNKQDRLANSRLYYWAYLLNGFVQTFGCFICFWLCFADFGFPMQYTWFLNSYFGIIPEDKDLLDASSPYLGNSNLEKYLPCTPGQNYLEDEGEQIDWLYFKHAHIDLRMTIVECINDISYGGPRFITRPETFGECHIQQISPFTLRPVCYSTEALKYAQTAFFFGVVVTQLSNSLCIKTRKLSMLYQGMKNQFMMLGFASEIIVTLGLAYIRGINIVFGTRDLIFIHYGIGAIPFAILMNLWDEIRKYLIRNVAPVNEQKASWWERNTLW